MTTVIMKLPPRHSTVTYDHSDYEIATTSQHSDLFHNHNELCNGESAYIILLSKQSTCTISAWLKLQKLSIWL
jgi:hypothetical protein